MKKITLFIFAEQTEINLDSKTNILNQVLYQYKQISLSIYTNLVFQKDYALLICGVGKTNASFALTNAIWKLKEAGFCVTNIINIGPVGSSKKENKITQTFLIDKAYFFDVDLRAIEGYKLGQLPDNEYEFQTSKNLNSKLKQFLNLEFSNILSADRFFAFNDIKTIEINFSSTSLLDMEVCSLIKVANSLNIEIAAIKVVSDNLFATENYYLTRMNDWKKQVLEVFLATLKEI
ncbi:5-methylthioadenosine nucleosidase/S-adenosyl homocysteine nucleosidase [Metamycoplasma auris 15026]|uniref:5-methylthioadenosine nucleosidase/S-adenosyl homocysteine nucleosidase n=1 Tax=Metamycoplasma auris 15026 TaxID=1188233 RepID=N9TR47_9BACT|nr:5-methylthioadenosine nucleosidase/S-adenosyl homocysteine nucleosidase [Metamycoplasma auris]ENY68550.1 5-methylthioadenosine nucleosidase/S-adenosyl homocysteine nucleosidase [Metamycoplasma auris 15026]